MITKIDSIDLYTASDWPISGSHKEAVDWLTNNGITFRHLNYADATQHPDCLKPLNTWEGSGGNLTPASFPFVIYTEVHDDLDSANYPKKFVVGIDAIKNSNLKELFQLGR